MPATATALRLARAPLLRAHTDSRLVELAHAGSDEAFEAIVLRYRRSLLRYCARLVPGGRAEDAVQQAFVNAHAALRGGTSPIDLRAWLFGIAHNATVSGLRQGGWSNEQLDPSMDGVERPDQAVERRESLDEILRLIEALPPRQRDAIVMRELEGRSYEEMAERLGVTQGAVRQLLNRGRNALRATASALIPPFLVAGSRAGERAGSMASRIAELCTGAGAGGAAAKAGLVAVVATGAIATGVGPALGPRPDATQSHAIDTPALHVALQPPAAVAAPAPVPLGRAAAPPAASDHAAEPPARALTRQHRDPSPEHGPGTGVRERHGAGDGDDAAPAEPSDPTDDVVESEDPVDSSDGEGLHGDATADGQTGDAAEVEHEGEDHSDEAERDFSAPEASPE